MLGSTYLLVTHCHLVANPHLNHNTILGMAINSRVAASHF